MLEVECPLVSIVIPCYNHERFIQDSIQSVVDQTYKNIELIIIDDGSQDNSVVKIQEMIDLCKQRFTRFEFRSRPNIGLSSTLNEGLEWCQGKYYSSQASDDQILKDKAAIQVEYLEKHNDICAVMGGVNWINSDNIIVSKRPLISKEYSFEEIFLLKQDLNVCTQMSRLDSIRNAGGYKDGFLVEDWYMWLKLTEKKSRVVSVPEYFVNYRVHINNTINDGNIIYTGLMQAANEYKHHPLYFKATKNIIWHYTASILIKDKKKGLIHFKSMLTSDVSAIFTKNFYRCIRNFAFK
ncbi:glycosyltransferase [Psychrobacter sp. GP33]|uniref:glycosyltransferase family 2 protein n=1 Tax=Psychrobacter sp. GP33 TaxID=2758709 RepID=UPI0015FA8305|nr:glycosyltransferase [Psychrobacter sp. GP33]